jgi:hypothetical protein
MYKYGAEFHLPAGGLFGILSALARDRFPSGIPHPHLLGDRGASIFFPKNKLLNLELSNLNFESGQRQSSLLHKEWL